MKPILLDLLMPIITPRLLIRPPQVGDGKMLNVACLSDEGGGIIKNKLKFS